MFQGKKLAMKVSGIWAVVPIKDLSHAKSRLSTVLTDEERRDLCVAMLKDVLRVVVSSPHLAGTLVVTADETVKRLAGYHGADVLMERANEGLCSAVNMAAQYLSANSCQGMIVIPGDVPMITHEEMAQVIKAHTPEPSVSLVPSRNKRGTNALLCCPPDAISPAFGEDSFSKHLEIAFHLEITSQVHELRGIGLDIDKSEDLLAFLAEGPENATRRMLEGLELEALMAEAS